MVWVIVGLFLRELIELKWSGDLRGTRTLARGGLGWGPPEVAKPLQEKLVGGVSE